MREQSEQAASVIRERIGGATIDVGLVLSSGLAAIADHVTSPIVVDYDDLPGFVRPRLGNEVGQCVVGTLGSARICVLKGRTHYHEYGNIDGMLVPIETLKLLGATAVVLTGAAGSLKKEIGPGAFVAIRDHINLTGINPLIGAAGDNRAVDLTDAYDAHLRERFALAGASRKTLEGTLMWFPGPNYETPAEINVARLLGADLVGMSIVPKTIIARQLGLRVLAVTTVTNFAAGMSQEALSREQSMRVSAASTASLTRVLMKFFENWVLDGRVR